MDKIRENRLRRQLANQGYLLRKSRAAESIDNLGGYMIISAGTNAIVGGPRFDFTLDDVDDYVNWLNEQEEE